MQLKSRRMQDLTWRGVEAYLERSDIAIIPVGSNEVHGALLPQGSDTFVAEAVAIGLAEKMDALIAPSITCTYTGGTRNFPGTISLPPSLVSRYLESVMLELIRNRFRRIYVIQWHAPYYAHQSLAREIFEKTNVPVAFFGLMGMSVVLSLDRQLLQGKCRETAVVSAALSILGKEELLDVDLEPGSQSVAPRPEDFALQTIAEAGGVVGHFYDHESQHVAFRKELNVEAGAAIINAVVDVIAGTADSLREYMDVLRDRNRQ